MLSLPVLFALLSGPPPVAPADGPVWVFFADKAVNVCGIGFGEGSGAQYEKTTD